MRTKLGQMARPWLDLRKVFVIRLIKSSVKTQEKDFQWQVSSEWSRGIHVFDHI